MLVYPLGVESRDRIAVPVISVVSPLWELGYPLAINPDFCEIRRHRPEVGSGIAPTIRLSSFQKLELRQRKVLVIPPISR